MQAQPPSLLVSNAQGRKNEIVQLVINTALLVDNSTTGILSIQIGGVSAGFELTAGTNNQDGTWTLESPELEKLGLNPPADFIGSVDLVVISTASEPISGTSAQSATTMTVFVT